MERPITLTLSAAEHDTLTRVLFEGAGIASQHSLDSSEAVDGANPALANRFSQQCDDCIDLFARVEQARYPTVADIPRESKERFDCMSKIERR